MIFEAFPHFQSVSYTSVMSRWHFYRKSVFPFEFSEVYVTIIRNHLRWRAEFQSHVSLAAQKGNCIKRVYIKIIPEYGFAIHSNTKGKKRILIQFEIWVLLIYSIGTDYTNSCILESVGLTNQLLKTMRKLCCYSVIFV